MTTTALRIRTLPLVRTRRRPETGPTPERLAELSGRDGAAAVRSVWAQHRLPW